MKRILRDVRTEVEREIQNHIDERAALLVDEGWDPREARREAARRFGDIDRIRREMITVCEDRRQRRSAAEFVASVLADVRYALRGIRANPTFSAATVSTLALGIGAAATIFAVADALLFRPLPYENHDRWVQVVETAPDGSSAGPVSLDRYATVREEADDLADAWIVFQWAGLSRTDGAQAETLDVLAVSPGADRQLGLPLALGRSFVPDDALPGAPATAVVTHRYWQRLGMDPGIVGRTIRLEDHPVTVVGVFESDAKFPPEGRDIDLWVPIRRDLSYLDRRLGSFMGVWALLPRDVGLPVARARLEALDEGMRSAARAAAPDPAVVRGSRGSRMTLTPVDAARAEPVLGALGTLGATVAALLLIAFLNGVNLLLVRTSARVHELGMRMALGASRARLARQLAVEGLVLGVVSGLAAVVVAAVAITAIRQVLPTLVTYISPHAIEVEARTLSFTFLLASISGLALGMIPPLGMLFSSSRAVATAGSRGGEDRGRRRLRDGLVVTQVALSMALLVAAGLLMNGFARLHRVEVGFDVEHVAVADLEPSRSRYPTPASRTAFAARLEEALEARPEVASVTLTGSARAHSGAPLEAEGQPVRGDQPALVPWSAVSPDYTETMGMRIVDGRPLRDEDAGTSNVLVDLDLARFLWPDGSALDRRFRVGDREWSTVVGVVEELRLIGRDERAGPYQYLTPRDPEAASRIGLAIRSAGPSADELVPVFQSTLRALDPQQSYWRVSSASEALEFNEEQPRFVLMLMGLLAGVSVSLAALGLYGVLAYTVERRGRELSIRVTLGAAPAGLRGRIVREGLVVASIGIGLGIGAALLGSTWLEQLLYDVPPRDPATYAATAGLFLAVAAIASFVPARRATRVDPVELLRSE